MDQLGGTFLVPHPTLGGPRARGPRRPRLAGRRGRAVPSPRHLRRHPRRPPGPRRAAAPPAPRAPPVGALRRGASCWSSGERPRARPGARSRGGSPRWPATRGSCPSSRSGAAARGLRLDGPDGSVDAAFETWRLATRSAVAPRRSCGSSPSPRAPGSRPHAWPSRSAASSVSSRSRTSWPRGCAGSDCRGPARRSRPGCASGRRTRRPRSSARCSPGRRARCAPTSTAPPSTSTRSSSTTCAWRPAAREPRSGSSGRCSTRSASPRCGPS